MPKQAYTVPCRASHTHGQGAQVLCTWFWRAFGTLPNPPTKSKMQEKAPKTCTLLLYLHYAVFMYIISCNSANLVSASSVKVYLC